MGLISLIVITTVFFLLRYIKNKKSADTDIKKLDFKKMTKQEFINLLTPAAKAIEKKYGIPYKFMVAQMGLETGWGISELFYKYFNVGGIKAVGKNKGKGVLEWTWEHVPNTDLSKYADRDKSKDKDLKNGKTAIYVQREFAVFPDLVSGLDYYIANVLMNKYFKHAVAEANGNPKKYVAALQQGEIKYATDTDYISKINSIIDTIV